MTRGFRTLDNRNHNPVLYQLSYGHHINRLPEVTVSLGKLVQRYQKFGYCKIVRSVPLKINPPFCNAELFTPSTEPKEVRTETFFSVCAGKIRDTYRGGIPGTYLV